MEKQRRWTKVQVFFLAKLSPKEMDSMSKAYH